MLSCFYIDNANYQENIIPRINKKDGHDVYIIASRDTFVGINTLGLKEAGSYINEDGIPVTRLDYVNFGKEAVSMKIRAYKGLEEHLEKIKPDVILFHGTCGWELNTVANYIK
ncbi:MAG: glycosyl transferase family 1, partial [Bacteroidia bacterium]